jgi:diadenosine tetraphosphate (Ap4A) HIT family hydrolase
MVSADAACPLCVQSGGEVLWDDGFARIVLADEADHPGFCRVILNAHRKEMTDLGEADRARLMNLVYVIERALRDLLQPDKVNLASLGNRVPHLHWHVIPRFTDDPHFPGAVWERRTGAHARPVPPGFSRTLRQHLAQLLAR